MLKVAIAGCGKIADAHAAQIQRIPGCEIVGVCDTEPLMAQQLHSASWYRVAELRPRLRSHFRVQRHLYRDVRWYVLQDAISRRTQWTTWVDDQWVSDWVRGSYRLTTPRHSIGKAA